MSSNIKPKSAAKDAPTEPFKRAVGVCLRAIAGKGLFSWESGFHLQM